MNLIRRLTPKSNNFNNTFAFNEQYVAYLIDEKTIELVDYTSPSNKSLKLDGHYNSIKCLKFSNKSCDYLWLCSCSIDYVILWDIKRILSSKIVKGKLLANNLNDEPICVSFSPCDDTLMICYGNIISFYDTQSLSSLGHITLKESFLNVDFCKFNADFICILTESGSLIIHRFSLNQQEFIIKSNTSASFINFCTCDSRSLIVASLSNNCINVYELSSEVFLLKTISIERLYFSHILKNTYEASDTDASLLPLSVNLLFSESTIKSHVNDTKKCDQIDELKIQKRILACATPICLLFIDLDAIQVLNIIEFKNTKFKITPQLVEFKQIDDLKIHLVAMTLFQNEIYIFSTKTNQVSDVQKSTIHEAFCLSVLNQDPLVQGSPLKQEVKLNTCQKSSPSHQEYAKNNKSLSAKSTIVKDKPLTFNSRIKSSGYSQPTQKVKMFQPKTNTSFKSNSLANLSTLDFKSKQINALVPQQTFQFKIPNKLVKQTEITDHSKPVIYLKTTDDGRILSSAQADNLVQCFLTSNLDKNSLVFRGHRDYIRHVDTSHDGRYLLSTGNDKACKLWSLKKPHDLIIDLSEYSKNGPEVVRCDKSETRTFKKDVIAANFFYLDKFMLLANENKIHLYKYLIDTLKSDIQSYLNNTVCKVVKTLEMNSAQSVTCLSTINSFYSYLVLVGGSDKSLEIFDMNKCVCCLRIEDAHTRTFHQISQNSSEFNKHSYDLFLTTAVGDGIKQWDLRVSGKCVKRFDEHNVRSIQSKLSQSPCGNYIFIGSEDKSVYVYDVRTSGVLEKFVGFSDTVMSVACSSTKSEVYFGTLDGKLYSYKFY